jgi:hypothetical protein
MKNNKWIVGTMVVILLLLSFTMAQSTTVGGESDPLVTLSYIEKRITELLTSIDQTYAKKSESSSSAATPQYEVVFVKAGQSLILSSSVEVILRSGEATAIASFNGGLSNLTAGVDLSQGVAITKNHLLLIPRDDGRGLKALTDLYVMVRGKYTIIQ